MKTRLYTKKITMKKGEVAVTLLVIEEGDQVHYWYGGNEYTRNQLLAIYRYYKEMNYKAYKEEWKNEDM